MSNSGDKSRKKRKRVDSSAVESNPMLESLQEIRKRSETEALDIIHNVMPKKIVFLSQLFSGSPEFNAGPEEVMEDALPETLMPHPVIATRSGASQEVLQEAVEKLARVEEGNGPQVQKRKLLGGEDNQEQEEGGGDDDEATEGRQGGQGTTQQPLQVQLGVTAEFSKDLHIPSNRRLKQIMSILKQEVLDAVYLCNSVKVWIQLNVPQISDGNNFGVSVQEETIAELARGEDSALAIMESMTKYFVTRARLVSKLIKYPQIEDYAQALLELDHKTYVHMRICGLDLRNNSIVLHDLVTKNLEKLKTPRRENMMSIGMY